MRRINPAVGMRGGVAVWRPRRVGGGCCCASGHDGHSACLVADVVVGAGDAEGGHGVGFADVFGGVGARRVAAVLEAEVGEGEVAEVVAVDEGAAVGQREAAVGRGAGGIGGGVRRRVGLVEADGAVLRLDPEDAALDDLGAVLLGGGEVVGVAGEVGLDLVGGVARVLGGRDGDAGEGGPAVRAGDGAGGLAAAAAGGDVVELEGDGRAGDPAAVAVAALEAGAVLAGGVAVGAFQAGDGDGGGGFVDGEGGAAGAGEEGGRAAVGGLDRVATGVDAGAEREGGAGRAARDGADVDRAAGAGDDDGVCEDASRSDPTRPKTRPDPALVTPAFFGCRSLYIDCSPASSLLCNYLDLACS
jgi:hypothetical protein